MTLAPLAGRRVVVTRTRTQAPTLVDRLERLGASVVELPVIAVVDPVDGGQALDRAAHRLVSGAYQWVALTSSNAVTRLLSVLDHRPVPSTVRWAAVGTATARAMAEAGVLADLVPAVSLSEALVEAFPPVVAMGPASSGHPTERGPEPSGTVLFPRAETVRGTLAAGLRAKGWLVDEVVAYRTVASIPAPEAVDAARRADAITFTSSSTVEHALELLGADGLPPVVVSIGPVTSGSARAAGVEVTREAQPHTIEGLVEAVVWALGAGGGIPPPGAGPGDDAAHRQQ
jgi:uroporphyrinogen-III synthase